MEIMMLVLGYKAGANFITAPKVIQKHTGKSLAEAIKLCIDLQNGKMFTLPDDFVLREDLEDLKFIVK